MNKLIDKIFFRSQNLNYINLSFKSIRKETQIDKLFDAINSFSTNSEIRYVGGCVRKIINKEKVDDIDLATNLEPKRICEALKKNNINYYETGIEHGTITAIIDDYRFEITTLREDVQTDGRHAKVKFSKDWKADASRRDFTINSIYSDRVGNLFDPFNGKEDLENGNINFIGDAEKRVKEDYLRILRYVRFFLNYSKQEHKPEIIRKLKMNIGGVSKLSKERLLDELKKIINLKTLEKLTKDKFSLELITIVFPELQNVNIFSKLKLKTVNFVEKIDFIFLLSLMIINETDNADYFLYKFNISKKDQKRIKIIDNFYKDKIRSTTFLEKNMNKIFYYYGKEAVIDIINFRIFKVQNLDIKLSKLIEQFRDKTIPTMPISADVIMAKYKIPEGKILGDKLKMIEEEWVHNNFKISAKQIENIIKR